MTKALFVLSAALYWISFLARFVLWTRPSRHLDLAGSTTEKLAMITFTSALVLYINALQIVNGEVHSVAYDRPVSFLLFAWAVSAAHLVTEVTYGNTMTAVFADFWTALSLTISAAAANLMKGVFTNDLEWLSFHRLCFLLGYAFCILAFPLVLRYIRSALRLGRSPPELRGQRERELWKVDRMGYRMVLWALPLLTAGIITEVLLMIDSHSLPSPEQLWTEQQESLLALTAWFLCGIYLHTRLFFGWRNLRSAALYLAGLLLLLGGHFSQVFLGSAS
jgi:ABC-type transport system involved in cytochrome c biogenesis permease subunit